MKTFLIVLVVLVGAIVVGYYAMPDAPFQVAEPDVDVMEVIEEESVPLNDGTYILVPEESTMQWRGSRPLIAGYFDNGLVSIASGSAVVASGSLVRGSVVIDMTSIAAESTGSGQGASMLTRHLKSDDWFGVEQYPEAEFVLVSYEEQSDAPWLVSGKLTMKDITASVSFPATVVAHEGGLTIRAIDIELDRTVWDVRFQSGSFFGNLGEKLVDDNFTLTFTAAFRDAVR